ncbi:spore germination protein [Bacillus sp. PS06]|uniref:spore germination protein n=1 Tax=Bacillus sp. PS06 TaxID=2764176 RepID=UPI001783FAD1|nr:spore germination protein [Bacillus sp. PS06]MBD8070360.1 spore germination protein [Bacillus sp. PS06]
MNHPEKVKQILKQQINQSHDETLSLFKEIFSHNDDLVYREFVFHDRDKGFKGTCIYADGLVNSLDVNAVLDLLVYRGNELLSSIHESVKGSEFAEKLKNEILAKHNVKLTDTIADAVDAILSGDSLIIIDDSEKAFIASTKGWKERSVEDPATEQVVRGPRDGFTENIRTNTALVRRRIRDPLFKLQGMKIGTKSKTDVNIAYLEGTVKEGLVEEVKNRLEQIEIDSVMDSGYIEELIGDAPYSPFTTVLSTERPDKVASAMVVSKVL